MIIQLQEYVATSYLSIRARKAIFWGVGKFFTKKIDKNEIKTIYTVHPLEGEENIFQDLINSECYSTAKMSKISNQKKKKK